MRDDNANTGWGTTPCRDVKLYRGTVLVNSVDCVCRQRGVRIYEVDLLTKYATIISTSTWLGAIEVILHADENSLYYDVTTAVPTTIRILVPGDVDRWNVMTECAKNTARIVVWRRSKWLTRRARMGEWFVSLAKRVTDIVDTVWEARSE